MGKIFFILFFTAAALSGFVACNKNDNPNIPSNFATTPQPCNTGFLGNAYQPYQQPYQQPYYSGYSSYWGHQNYATTPSNPFLPQAPYNPNAVNAQYCQNNMYSGYWNQNTSWYYGQWYWPQQYMPNTANCGCPTGYMAVYGPSYGVACAPATYGNYWGVVYYSYNWYGGPAHNSYPLNTPQAQYTGSFANNCQTSTAQGCDTRLNNCPSGSICQPAGGGSTIGLCIRQ